VVEIPGAEYPSYAADPRNGLQIGVQKWAADYPAASNFLRVLFGCRPEGVAPADSWNWSRFCDPRAERLTRRATRVTPADPVAADRLWAQADRRVVDAAAAVPLLNQKTVTVVSRRTGNVRTSPQWGVLIDQLWVR
jgi:peptide/nickel transport system substrate-binding protein